MPQIDLHSILDQAVASGNKDLVTRRTGEAVRVRLEEHFAGLPDGDVTVIDFSSVRCLDYSCADEIVGKLLLEHGGARYFVLRGLSDWHQEAIETVLERYALAVAAQDREGQQVVLGRVDDHVRRAFAVVSTMGRTSVEDLAGNMATSRSVAEAALSNLLRHRLAVEDSTSQVRALT